MHVAALDVGVERRAHGSTRDTTTPRRPSGSVEARGELAIELAHRQPERAVRAGSTAAARRAARPRARAAAARPASPAASATRPSRRTCSVAGVPGCRADDRAESARRCRTRACRPRRRSRRRAAGRRARPASPASRPAPARRLADVRPQRALQVGVHVAQRHADVAARHAALVAQLRQDGARPG